MPLPAIGIPAAIGIILSFMAVRLVIKVLAALGIGYGVYSGFTTFQDFVVQQMQAHLGATSAELLNVAQILNIDKAVNIILAAYVVRLVLRGMSGGIRRIWGAS